MNAVVIILFVLLMLASVVLAKGEQWCQYKWLYVKRSVFNAFGHCHKCRGNLSYTENGRGICLNEECKK